MKLLFFLTLHDLKECIRVVIVHQKHSLVVFQSFEKNVFLEFKLILATFCNFSRIYTVTKNASKKKKRLLTISQKSLHKNFRRPIIFSKRSESSKFFFERLAQPLNPFGIKNLLHHTSCCGSRWNILKKTPFVNNVNMTLEMLL